MRVHDRVGAPVRYGIGIDASNRRELTVGGIGSDACPVWVPVRP